ncbi:MAG: 5'/3'-nucleotidase SurE [Opitutales bacterium]
MNQSMKRPHALVTNDDGIESAFLHELVTALLPEFRVSVAAPAFEQSWIGRAVTRLGEVEVIHSPSVFSGTEEAWAISGTPTDCINIALGHLLPDRPDIVLSGINIGYNTTETLILSSGTIAGAMEGALWGLPAIAFSQCVPSEHFEEIRDAKGRTTGHFNASLQSAAAHACFLAKDALHTPPPSGTVLNVNFPAATTASTTVLETYPAKLELGSLFKESRPGKYHFSYHDGRVIHHEDATDRAALDAGHISRSLLDFSRIGRGARPDD